MTSAEAFAKARHMGRYAHYDSVVWPERAGGWQVQRYSREALKKALMAVGTSGKFYVDGGRHPHIIGWREGVLRLRDVRFTSGMYGGVA